jgi:V8-like Glu-specific endopeptidase
MTFDSKSYPYDTVVYITDTIGGTAWQGSGVLISPDEVLTASHVVYSSTYGTASNITVTPAYNAGSQPFGSATETYIHYFQIQDPGDLISIQQSQYDYAVIHLSKPFTGLGTMGLRSNFSGGLANVTGYPGAFGGQMITSPQYVTQDPNYTVLDGSSLGHGSSGGPVWITGSDGSPRVVGVVSSEAGGAGVFTQITTTALNQIEAWVTRDDAVPVPPPTPVLSVNDTSVGTSVSAIAQQYTGPVAGLLNQYINITADSLNIAVTSPGWFLHSGSGTDAIAASSGTNVLDGGTGSNFLTGGTGNDTVFLDNRGPNADLWSTVVGFHAGDAATIWGVTPTDFAINTFDNRGAAGYTGLTFGFTAIGKPNASLTLAGFASADLTSGRLTVAYGTTPDQSGLSGSTYMLITGN